MKIDRQAVYQKFGGRCAYCGKPIDFKDMQVDHVVPKFDGGTDDISNLFPTCRRCNHYKRAETLESFRSMVQAIPVKLMEREYIFKVGVDFGFFTDQEQSVKFYFEKARDEDHKHKNKRSHFFDRSNYTFTDGF